MYNLCIDPFLIAYPQVNSGIDEFENYIHSLTLWGEEIEKIKEANLATVYLSAKTSEILDKIHGYPEWDDLEKIIRNLNLQDVIHPHEIFTLIQGFLKLPSLEDRLSVNEILVDDLQCEPSCYLAGRNEIFIKIYYELAGLIFLLCQIENLECNHQIIITRNIQVETTRILVKGEIFDCEFFNNLCCLSFPHEINGCLQSFVEPKSLYYYFDAVEIWINANSCENIYQKAINIYIFQINSQLETPKPTSELSCWSFGSRFLKTVKSLGFLNEPLKTKMLLRTCAETILKQNLVNTHGLRTGKGANNPQKKRKKDGSAAWRRDIDYEYHLHYWETANNSIEFASVVVHNNMKIPE